MFSLERPGIHDHFFDLGGHSLKAMLLASRINKEKDSEVTDVRAIFEHPTIAELAAYIDKAEGKHFAGLIMFKHMTIHSASARR